MNLKLRLNMIVAFVLFTVLMIGAFSAIRIARGNISAEIASTAVLALKMLDARMFDFGLDQNWSTHYLSDYKSIFQLDQIKDVRHIRVEFYDVYGELKDSNISEADRPINGVPNWFFQMMDDVSSTMPSTSRQVFYRGHRIGELVVTPDPSYEIAEIWTELETTFSLFCLFFIVVNILIFFAVGIGLKPIDKIIAGLTDIESGNLSVRLPKFGLPEISQISEKFNVMAETLQLSAAKNHQLTQQIIRLQDEERKNLARELHDEVGQYLTAINVDSTAIMSAHQMSEARESATAISQAVKQMMEMIHNILKRLRPGDLEELGLTVALSQLVANWETRNKQIQCHLLCESQFNNVSDEVLLAVYRIVQECLTNISKHADASNVEINCINWGDKISLKIRDDGKGFDKKEKNDGFGLAGIQERVESLDGDFILKTRQDSGTTIEIVIPVEKEWEYESNH